MTLSAPQLPEIDERQLDDQFYRCTDMAPAHLELLQDAEEQIKTSFLASHRQTAEALSRVRDLVSPSLFEEWTIARFDWDLSTVEGIVEALPAAEKQVAQLKSERKRRALKMREEGMTQKQTAEAIGVSREAVRDMERGVGKGTRAPFPNPLPRAAPPNPPSSPPSKRQKSFSALPLMSPRKALLVRLVFHLAPSLA